MADDGVTVVLVEQSVNVASTVAERAYFMERGTIMFDGPTKELLERPDLLRSVFLASAGADEHDAEPTERTVIGDASTPVLSVHELSVTFGGIRAVDGTTFDVWSGEIVGVIGPNGAGKTTMFDLVSGFTPSTAGTITLNGREHHHDERRLVRAQLGLGRSFQDARLFPELTVQETLAIAQERFVGSRSVFVAALHLPMAVDSEEHVALRTDELIELMGLGDYRHSFVRELSTGTRRVVDLACLVAHRPAVILLDEPTSGIAQREVEALSPVVRRLRDEMGRAWSSSNTTSRSCPRCPTGCSHSNRAGSSRPVGQPMSWNTRTSSSHTSILRCRDRPIRGNGVDHATSTGRGRGFLVQQFEEVGADRSDRARRCRGGGARRRRRG